MSCSQCLVAIWNNVSPPVCVHLPFSFGYKYFTKHLKVGASAVSLLWFPCKETAAQSEVEGMKSSCHAVICRSKDSCRLLLVVFLLGSSKIPEDEECLVQSLS